MSEIITHGIYDTNIGKIVVAQSAQGLCWLGFMVEGYKGDGLDRLIRYFPDAEHIRDDTGMQALMTQILEAWRVDTMGDITLDLRGTDFQKSVWAALVGIQKGAVCTYGDVARAIGKPKAARAVGSAVGENPVSLIVPCHRVVQGSGGLGNYGWGVDIKRDLLVREGAISPV